MIAHKKEFYGGVGMMAAFIVVLVIIFSPVINGQNGLDYLDALYNSISKGSAYYIPKVRESSTAFNGKEVDVTINMHSAKAAGETAWLFKAAGALVNAEGKTLKVSGDLGKIIDSSLNDADAMYNNNSTALVDKYTYDGRQALYYWWTALKLMEKDLKKQEKFKEAKMVAVVIKKAVECSYNFYGIESKKITDSLGVVIFSLLFYVVYTMWYGFAVMFMFEGWGMKLDH
ncbi:MAG: hypothetical protein GY697_28170 [Desulfobacterales bacterium]|nr:hypothetical protein [Desulfobacterales bacterium]